MSDEVKVRYLFESVARPVDLDGRLFKVDRAEAVATILRAAQDVPLRQTSSKSRWRLGVGVAAALALAASAVLVLRGHDTPVIAQRSLSLEEVHGSVTQLGANGNVVAAGNESRAIPTTTNLVTAAGSGARIRSSDGFNIELLENSRLSLVGLGLADASNVQLLAGSIHCEVPALAKGHQFSVATPDATIVVHGTAFSVIVSGIAAATHTCVKVEHGEVLVRARMGDRLLASGDAWGCTAEPAAPTQSAPPSGTGAAASTSSGKSSKPRERAVEGKPVGGTLDEENRLFQAGLAAERVGDFRAANQALEQLLATHPASPLAADARLALSRVKSHLAPVP